MDRPERGVGSTARWNIRPGEALLVLTETGWHEMRWGVIPVGRVLLWPLWGRARRQRLRRERLSQ